MINIYHGLKFKDNICIGCSQCMSNCPTEAIRVRNGKAVLLDMKCIDCGECYNVCPSRAIHVEQDDFEDIASYKHRVALLPAIFIAQFPPSISIDKIISAIYKLGFTDIQIVERSVGIVEKLYKEYMESHVAQKPLISTFCPSIVRLIQTKFPYFIDNLILLKPPLELTALYIRKKYEEQNIDDNDVGVFYISPCAAKLVAVKDPVGGYKSPVNGIINMNYLYNKVYREIKNGIGSDPQRNYITIENSLISLTNGETSIMSECRKLAIDGIHNVIEFLEYFENGENELFENIDFLELRSCGEGCAGGILCAANKFISAEQLKSLNHKYSNKGIDDIYNYEDYLRQNAVVSKVEQRSVMKLDNDMFLAMKKMRQIEELKELLPQVDCGICGAPTCGAFSEDIVQGEAITKQCVFIQKTLEKTQQINTEESTTFMENIWSKDKFDKIVHIMDINKD